MSPKGKLGGRDLVLDIVLLGVIAVGLWVFVLTPVPLTFLVIPGAAFFGLAVHAWVWWCRTH